MAITPLPALDRTSSTFKADVDIFFASQIPAFIPEANALQADVSAKQAAAAGSASAASTSASSSANSATNAATSATNASTSSTNAAYSANAAANSAANAATGAANAKIHADRLLASSATAPTTRGDGTPLQIGDRYVNTGSQAEYIYKSFGWVSNDSMVAIDELQGSLADPADGPRIIAFRQGGSSPVTKDTYEKIRSTVSIRDFGSVFDGAASNTSALQNACNLCVSLGISVLMVDVPFVNLLSDVDCKNVRLQCSETKFVGVGRLNNNAGIIGGYIAGIAQDEVFKAPAGMLCAKSSMKILYKASTNEMWLLAKKARNGGYFRTRILWNSFLVEGSVAGQSELWRCAQVQNLATVYGYKKTATNKVGTWTDLDIPLSSGGTGRPYKVNVTSTLNDYIEYSFSGNEVSLGLYQSSGSTTGATVQIDGVTVETINLQQATAGVLIKRYFTTTGGAHTLRITRTLGGGTMYVAGINIAELSALKPSADIDCVAYSVLGATVGNGADRDYIINGGATDYAFHDGALLAGSVHGGELSDYVSWKVDGAVTDISAAAVGSMWTAESVVIEQRTNFGWDATRRFDTRSLTDFTLDGGWTFSCQMSARPAGGINLTQNYTNLTTTNPIFTSVDYPIHVDTLVDEAKTSIGRTEYVRQRNPSTGDTVESFMTLGHREDSKFGGVHIWRSPGAYNKVYYASACYGLMNFKNLAFTTRKQFS